MNSPISESPDPNVTIASLYRWGARATGVILLGGVVFQFSRLLLGGDHDSVRRLAEFWPGLALISLWTVPVFSLTIAGSVRVVRNRLDWTGWTAIGIGVFLSSLWFLK